MPDTKPASQALDDVPIWGAKNIAAVLNLSERATFHALQKKLLPASKVGKVWVSTRRRLLGRIVGDGV